MLRASLGLFGGYLKSIFRYSFSTTARKYRNNRHAASHSFFIQNQPQNKINSPNEDD